MISKKLLLLGEIGVGKTSLVRRLVLDELPSDYRPTIGVDIYRFAAGSIGSASRSAELVIWDIDGNYGRSIFQHVYSRGASAAFIIGDVTRPPTLDMMLELADGFQEAMPGRHFGFILNKLDLVGKREEVVLPDRLARAKPHPRWTSAMTGEHVREAFMEAAEIIVRREA